MTEDRNIIKKEIIQIQEQARILQKKKRDLGQQIEDIRAAKRESKIVLDDIAARWKNTEIAVLAQKSLEETEKACRKATLEIEDEIKEANIDLKKAMEKEVQRQRQLRKSGGR